MNDTTHFLTWPPDRFYWGLCASADTDPAEALAEVCPTPDDHLHVVHTPLSDGRLLVCGASRDALHDLDEVITLHPSSLPPHLTDLPQADVRALNVLTGEFLPKKVASARRRRVALATVTMLLCTLFVWVGINRRSISFNRSAHHASRTALQIAQAALGTTADDRTAIQMLAQRAQQARSQMLVIMNQDPVPDVDAALAELLMSWPANFAAEADSISATRHTITLSCWAGSLEQAQQIASSIQAPTGWRMDEPRLTTQPGRVRISLRSTPVKSPPHPGPRAMKNHL